MILYKNFQIVIINSGFRKYFVFPRRRNYSVSDRKIRKRIFFIYKFIFFNYHNRNIVNES